MYSSMMLLDDKLYIRHSKVKEGEKPVPFVVVDKNSLKEIKLDPELSFEPKEGDNHSLLWKEEDDKGRYLS